MMGMVSNYDPMEHAIITGELDAFVKRLVRDDPTRRLFVVRYLELGVFVIAEWLGKPKDVFVDVMNLGKSLSSFDRHKAEELRSRLFEQLSEEETSRQITDAESDYHHMRQDENSEEHERLARCAMGE